VHFRQACKRFPHCDQIPRLGAAADHPLGQPLQVSKRFEGGAKFSAGQALSQEICDFILALLNPAGV
jgi:hypothetical protein